jgi:cobalt-zinc-cadmium efflux system membrane fusion protein
MKNTLLLLLLLFPLLAGAHGDEVHTGGQAGPAGYFSSEAVSDKYELLVKYAGLEPGREGDLTLYVSDYLTNLPMDSLTLEVTCPELPGAAFTTSRLRPGVYALHATFPEAKAYTLVVGIKGPRGPDLLAVPGIEAGRMMPDDEGAAADDGGGLSTGLMFALGVVLGGVLVLLIGRGLQRRLGPKASAALWLLLLWPASTIDVRAHGDEPHGGESPGGAVSAEFIMPKETQFLFRIETDRVGSGRYQSSALLNGTVLPADNGQAVLSSPQTGTLTRLNTRTGASVAKGQVLAVIETTLDPSTRITLESERNALRAELAAAQKGYDRLVGLSDIAAKKDIDEARARLDRARANLNLLSGNTGRYVTLRAPISGVVDPFNLATGSSVNAGEPLFTISNTGKVVIEARVFPRDLTRVRAAQSFVVERGGDRPVSAPVRLLSVTPVVDPSNQSQLVLFELTNARGQLSIGELVSVRALGAPASAALLLPNDAITELSGKAAVFVKDAAEHYSLAYVDTGDNNGTHTAVLGGLEEGQRVVISGAYQMKMVYLNQ